MRSEEFRATAFLRASRCFWGAIAVFAAGSISAPAVFAQCSYEVSAIISPNDGQACAPFPASNTFAIGMNSKGEVVGWYVPCAIGNERAFYWSKDTGFVTLPKPTNVSQAYASAINDHGIIIGRHVFSGVGSKGYVYDPKTQEFTYLEPLHPGATAAFLTRANSINNTNIIVGDRVISEPGATPVVRQAVVWLPFGEDGNGPPVTIDLGDFGVGPNSALLDLTQTASHLVGWTGPGEIAANGVRIVNGNPEVFGPVPTTESSSFRSVSESGHIAAHGINLAKVYARGALLIEGKWLVIEPPEGFQSTGIGSLNNLGQLLVGCSGPLFRPHLWQHGEMTDLNELLHDPPPSLVLTDPSRINDAGQILVRGSQPGMLVGALLAPIDRPTTDLNADCVTDAHDLIMLLKQWGPCGVGNCPADFTGDGVVGVLDLLILLANW